LLFEKKKSYGVQKEDERGMEPMAPIPTGRPDSKVSSVSVDIQEYSPITTSRPSPDSIEIENVAVEQKLGEGNFGEVYLGKWGHTKVALKSIKDQTQAVQFIREFKLLLKLRHPNIVSCFGIHTNSEGKMYMVMEYVSLGSVDNILRDKEYELKDKDLLDMIMCAALGMEYLEHNGIQHRDMACRNLLATKIDNSYVVKCCDFGLSKEATYYYSSTTSNAKIPIRWSAPEILKGKKFTNKADVWSFGITMWEVYSFGQIPYAWMSNQEVYESVVNGAFLLKKPERCPEEIFSLIRDCCKPDPTSRPNFPEVARRLEKMYKDEQQSPSKYPYMDVHQKDDSTTGYVNTESKTTSPMTGYVISPPSVSTNRV